MGMIIPEQILLGIVVWLVLALFSGMVLSWIWALRRLLGRQPLLPERPLVDCGPPPWGGGTVLLVIVTYLIGNALAIWGYALATQGVADAEQAARVMMAPGTEPQPSDSSRTDPGPTAAARQGDRPGAKRPAGGPPAPARSTDAGSEFGRVSLTELMLVQTAVSVVLLVLLPLVVRATSGAQLRDFGLSFEGWTRQAAVGVVAVLIAAPLVYGIQHVLVNVLHVRPRAHPVEKMLRDQTLGGVACLAILAAVIVAPLLEELMFRGIFQRWMIALWLKLEAKLGAIARHRPSPQLAQVIPALPAEELNDRASPLPETVAPSGLDSWEANDPEFRAPKPEAKPGHRGGGRAGIAIGITSLLFAVVHGAQWPAPIPLFVLSLAIGVVYSRTGSLIAAICMHALFNGFSMLGLITLLVAGPPSEAEKVIPPPALERNAPAERSAPLAPGIGQSPG
jgi:membrane protease YdiL (CAAX protease family)